MKKITQLLPACFLLFAGTTTAQVGIGTTAPHATAALEISSTAKGFLPPRMTTAQRDAIATPAGGLTVFNTTTNCLNFYSGISWYSPCGAIHASSGGTAVIAAVTHCGILSAGTLTAGAPASGVSQTIRVNASAAGTYDIGFNTNGVSWSSTGTLGTGLQDIVLTASGTPLEAGTISHVLPTTPGCSFDRTVECIPLAIATNFSGGLGDTSPFNTKELLAGQAGTWSIVSGGGTLIGSTYTAPVLNGKSSTVTLQFTSSGPCVASKQFTFGVSSCYAKVSSTEYVAFMCHNLGADTSFDPAIPVKELHGDYYQWRSATVVANATTPEGAINGWNTSSAPTTGAWSGTYDDPCPTGYTVPSGALWNDIVGNNTLSWSGSWSESYTNFGAAVHFGPAGSPTGLTLPAAGYRKHSDGALQNRGNRGFYWASEWYGDSAMYLELTDTAFNSANLSATEGASGFPVRCVAK